MRALRFASSRRLATVAAALSLTLASTARAAATHHEGGSGATRFRAWAEPGPEPAAWRWSLSRDGGKTWGAPRRVDYDLKLRNRPIVPADGRSELAGPGRVYLVQFRTPSLAAWRARLGALGAEVLQPVPHNAHLVRMAPEVAKQVAGLDFVRWVGRYRPADRLDPMLAGACAGDHAGIAGSARYTLQTYTAGPAEKALLAAEVASAGGKVVRQTPSGYLIEADLRLSQACLLAASDHLLWIEPWRAPEPDLDITREASGANYIETVAGYDGTGVAGEVLDGGIQTDHPDFDGIQVHGAPDAAGSHGTCTYGIVFGNGDRDGDGEARGTGLLPAGTGWTSWYTTLSDRYQHTRELVEPPIEAVFQSNSWGSGRTLHYTAISAEMDDIAWLYDFPIFQSQSNSGDQYSRPQSWAKNVISIGGINHQDTADPADDCWCNGGSIGPAEDGRIKPELSHFFDAVYSPDREPGGYANGSFYADFGGTSAATPVVAGLGGLVLEMWAANLYGNNPAGTTVFEKRPRLATLKALMVNTAVPYAFSGRGGDLPRARQGWGVPNVRVLHDRAPLTRVVDGGRPLEELGFDAFLVPVAAGQAELKVTMAYTDRAGVPAATLHRVNDLSLRVIAPDGTVYWGNQGLEDGLWSLPGGGPDPRNTLENVFVENPMAGDWRVEVEADEVNQDALPGTPAADQDYSLVVYGGSRLDECRTPVAPASGLTATAAGPNSVDLAWTGGAASYEVWRAIGGCAAPRTLAGTASVSRFTDTAPGRVRVGYVVRALGGCPSPDSACVEVTPSGGCDLDPQFAGVAGAIGVSSTTCGIRLSWAPAASPCGGQVVYNVYRSTDPAFVPSAANRVASCVGTTDFTDLAGLATGADYSYVVRAEALGAVGSGPCGGREEGNLTRRRLGPTTLLRTDFEAGLDGWVSLAPGNSITGEFVVDDPEGTLDNGNPAQPEDDHSPDGVKCLFTGRNPNRSAAQADVDFGEVVALSPVFDASAFPDARLGYWRWHHNRDLGEDPDDYFAVDVSNDGGGTWTTVEMLTSADDASAWTENQVDLAAALPLTATMSIRVRSSDGPGPNGNLGNLLESALDDVVVASSAACATGSRSPGVIAGAPGPLVLTKSGLNARLRWSPDCAGAPRYGVYEGDLALGLPSLAPVAGLCDVAATTVDLPRSGPSRFYLIAPNDGAAEGSLGLYMLGQRRPPATAACYPRSVDTCAP